MERWAEHFNKVLNCSSKVNEEALARIPQTDQNAELDGPPDAEEVTKASKQISNQQVNQQSASKSAISKQISKAALKTPPGSEDWISSFNWVSAR